MPADDRGFGSHVKRDVTGTHLCTTFTVGKVATITVAVLIVFMLSYYEFSPTNFVNPIDKGVPSTLVRPKNHMSVHALEALRGSDSGGFSKVIGSVSDLHFVLFGDLQKTEAEENYLCCMDSNRDALCWHLSRFWGRSSSSSSSSSIFPKSLRWSKGGIRNYGFS